MQIVFRPLFLAALVACSCAAPALRSAVTEPRTTASFDISWRFFKGDASGAEKPAFDDASWSTVDVPHDWAIEGAFDQEAPSTGAGAFLPAGVAWYRKSFTLPAAYAGRRVFIEFDGVVANSDVWINGTLLGHRPNGFISFRYELTSHLGLGPDHPNIIAVRADTSAQPASRWYMGSGINRRVRLVVTDPVHIEPWGIFVTTPKVTPAQALVHIQTTVVNQSDTPRSVAVQGALLASEADDKNSAVSAPQTIAPGQSAIFEQDISLSHPTLWDLDHPKLMQARMRVVHDNQVLDEETVSFGIRDARFEPTTGFWLNGKNLKIKGVCLHENGGAFGAAIPLSVWEQRLTALRTYGVNAIRTTHNPPAPAFLDLCDRMGFLVMDEAFDCWSVGKTTLGSPGHPLHDYHLFFNEWSKTDLRDMVRRDRNHPSIIIYSAGNEIHDTPNGELATGILAGLVKVFHENDPTRPVTQALLRPNRENGTSDYTDGLADLLDVVGTNYRDSELLAAWKAKPTWKILGTEQRQDSPTWVFARDNPQHAGQFIWAGIDYLGEARAWPLVASGSGLIDRNALPRGRAFERQSWWSDQPVVHLARKIAPTTGTSVSVKDVTISRVFTNTLDWTPADKSPHDETVLVFSNCEQVELFLNNQSLGVKSLPTNAEPREWTVPYAAGQLRAVGTNHGAVVATDEMRSAGPAARLVLAVDTNSLALGWDRVARVTVTVVDVDGTCVPEGAYLIKFALTGPGVIAAVDNGDNAGHESFRGNQRDTYKGCCVAYLRSTADAGAITLTASADGLANGSVTLKAGSGKQ